MDGEAFTLFIKSTDRFAYSIYEGLSESDPKNSRFTLKQTAEKIERSAK